MPIGRDDVEIRFRQTTTVNKPTYTITPKQKLAIPPTRKVPALAPTVHNQLHYYSIFTHLKNLHSQFIYIF